MEHNLREAGSLLEELMKAPLGRPPSLTARKWLPTGERLRGSHSIVARGSGRQRPGGNGLPVPPVPPPEAEAQRQGQLLQQQLVLRGEPVVAGTAAAASLTADVIRLTGLNMSVTTIARLRAMGLFLLAAIVAKLISDAMNKREPGWLYIPQEINSGPGYVDYTAAFAGIFPDNPYYFAPVTRWIANPEGGPVIALGWTPVDAGPPPWVGGPGGSIQSLIGDSGMSVSTAPGYASFPADKTLESRVLIWEGTGPGVVIDTGVVTLPGELSPPRRGWRDAGPPPVGAMPWPQARSRSYGAKAESPPIPDWVRLAPQGRRERKARVSEGVRHMLAATADGKRILEWLLEAGDSINALWNALPPQLRRIEQQLWYEEQFARGNMEPGRISPDAQAGAVLRNWRFVDVDGAIGELAWETTQDTLYGLTGQQLQRAMQRLGLTGGAGSTVSPTWEHPLDPSLPFAGQYRVRDRTTKQMVTVPEAPLHYVMQRITGRAARDAAHLANPSPELRAVVAAERTRRQRNYPAERARRRDYAVWRNGRPGVGQPK